MPINYSAFSLYTNIDMYMFPVSYLSLHVSIYSPKYLFIYSDSKLEIPFIIRS